MLSLPLDVVWRSLAILEPHVPWSRHSHVAPAGWGKRSIPESFSSRGRYHLAQDSQSCLGLPAGIARTPGRVRDALESLRVTWEEKQRQE